MLSVLKQRVKYWSPGLPLNFNVWHLKGCSFGNCLAAEEEILMKSSDLFWTLKMLPAFPTSVESSLYPLVQGHLVAESVESYFSYFISPSAHSSPLQVHFCKSRVNYSLGHYYKLFEGKLFSLLHKWTPQRANKGKNYTCAEKKARRWCRRIYFLVLIK